MLGIQPTRSKACGQLPISLKRRLNSDRTLNRTILDCVSTLQADGEPIDEDQENSNFNKISLVYSVKDR